MENLFQLACQTAMEAAALLREQFASNAGIQSSRDKDIKTDADLAAQDHILKRLAVSGIPVLAEEGEHGGVLPPGPCWIVDPLDGTLNFARGFAMAAVSIALWDGTVPIIGVIVEVFHGEIYSADVARGAWLNRAPICVSKVANPSQAVIATGFPSGRSYDEHSLLAFVKKVQQFKKVRMLGSATLMLAQVAAGRFDIYEEEDIYLWDVAAGLALVKAAGGAFSMHPGTDPFKFNIRASNGIL